MTLPGLLIIVGTLVSICFAVAVAVRPFPGMQTTSSRAVPW